MEREERAKAGKRLTARPEGTAACGGLKPLSVTKIQLSLVVPAMRERVLCELPLEAAPKTDILDRWEMEESWVVVSADGMRALGFARSNVRAGEKAVGALVVFQGSAVREATAEERKRLQEARKAAKLLAKQRRAARRADKEKAERDEIQGPAATVQEKQSA
jgi:hypothetical protein